MNEKTINKLIFSIIILLSFAFLGLLILSLADHLKAYSVSRDFSYLKLPLGVFSLYFLGIFLSLLVPIRFIQKYLSRTLYYFTVLLGIGLVVHFIFLYISNSGSNDIYGIYFGALLSALFIYLTGSGFFLTGFVRMFIYKKK